jgi:branched-chain amino acid aminotransferase
MVNLWKLKTENQEVPLEFVHEAETLDAASQEIPAGVYTTFRTYHNDQVLRLQQHFDRLVTSAELQDVHFRLDQENIRKGLRVITCKYSGDDVRLRIHWSIKQSKPCIYLMGEKFHPIPIEMYSNGVAAQTLHLSRENPLSKSTSFINETSDLRASRPADVHEYLLVGKDNEILEGMTSNVFCIMNGTLFTASSGVLLGITRQLVLEAVGKLSIPVVHQGIAIKDLDKVDEVFITSASRGVLPVTRLDGKNIRSGKPGSLTQKISSEFNLRLESELESI